MNNDRPVLLDTHYWIWPESGDKHQFPPDTLALVDAAAEAGRLLLSVISIWELGMLESKGRVRLATTCDAWVRKALATPGLTLAL